jgi:hypothetical protein
MNDKQIEFVSLRAKSWHIFKGNYDDLCASCDELENPTQEYKNNESTIIMHEDAYIKMLNVERKFHNFLASAKTLVDHTRVLMKGYAESPLYSEYEGKIKIVGRSPMVKFCHDVRNYFLHQKNPANNYLIHQTWYEDDNVTIARGYVRISKDSLLEHSNWSPESKKIINLLEKPFDIRELADVYFEEVSEVNEWINTKFAGSLK